MIATYFARLNRNWRVIRVIRSDQVCMEGGTIDVRVTGSFTMETFLDR